VRLGWEITPHNNNNNNNNNKKRDVRPRLRVSGTQVTKTVAMVILTVEPVRASRLATATDTRGEQNVFVRERNQKKMEKCDSYDPNFVRAAARQ
jgi:hypothetical protein